MSPCLSHQTKRTISLLLVALCLAMAGVPDSEAKKGKSKAKGPSEADLQKSLTSMDKDLMDLVKKSQSRTLFSPEETGTLTEIRFNLIDLMNSFPGNPLLSKPAYQAAKLYAAREMWQDAYDVYRFLVEKYPTDPYGMRAKSEMALLVKQKGADFFPPAVATSGDPSLSTADAGKPNTAAKK
jgi:hypothetical protein